MAINTHRSTTQSKNKNKINEQAEQKQTHKYREHFDGCQAEGGLAEWAKKVNGLRNTYLLLQNSHADVKYSIGNIINNILITMHGVRQVLDLLR